MKAPVDDDLAEPLDLLLDEYPQVFASLGDPPPGRPHVPWGPEQMLVAAVLLSAMEDLRNPWRHPGSRKEALEELERLREWVGNPYGHARGSGYTVQDCCDALGIRIEDVLLSFARIEEGRLSWSTKQIGQYGRRRQ